MCLREIKIEIIYQDSEFTNIREYHQRMMSENVNQILTIRVYHGKFVSNTYGNLTIEI